MKKYKQNMAIAMAAALLLTSVSACSGGEEDKTSSSGSNPAENTASAAQNDPYGKYSEEVTLNMGRQTVPNDKLPEGDTYEDNAYTRMVHDMLNVKIVDTFEASNEDYDRQVALTLSSGEMPDMMKVNNRAELKELYENDLIADLTDVYEAYATDAIKEIYDSFDGRTLANVTYDGRMYAVPGTKVDPGPSQLWVRKDWIDKIGYKDFDKDGDRIVSLDEVKALAEAFMQANPNKADNLVGIAFQPSLTSENPEETYTINSIAYSFGAYPKVWLNNDGEALYGSVDEKNKEALKLVADWYKEGLIDDQLGTRTFDDITALLANGQCGICFGAWHVADWALNNVRATDNNADFASYAIDNGENKVNITHVDASQGYMVVRKDYEHPEVAIKILNLFYDKLANDRSLLDKYPDVAEYQRTGVDGSVRPFNIEVLSATSLLDDYDDIRKGLSGEISLDQVRTTESLNVIKNVESYEKDPENCEVVDWSKYHSRMKGIELIRQLTEADKINWVSPYFPETTSTMDMKWANLLKLEEESYIKMATAAVDVDQGFEEFVNAWNSQGGAEITKEVSEQLQK